MMDMIFQEQLSLDQIREGLEQAFGVDSESIDAVLLADLIRNPGKGRLLPIHAELVPTRGDFRTLVKLHVAPQFTDRDRVGFARRLCAAVHSPVLIPDDSPSPYSWVLVGLDGDVRAVDLDADSMDDREEYVLAGKSRRETRLQERK